MTGFITLTPVGVVRGGRTRISEDHWGTVESRLALDPVIAGPEATAVLRLRRRPEFAAYR